MRYEEFEPCLNWWSQREENDNAWKVSVGDILKYENGVVESANLDVKNPKSIQTSEYISPDKLAVGILDKERQVVQLIEEIKDMLGKADHD